MTGVRKTLDSARKKMSCPFLKLDAQWKKLRCARKKAGGQCNEVIASFTGRIM
jgi:hypothetical protein